MSLSGFWFFVIKKCHHHHHHPAFPFWHFNHISDCFNVSDGAAGNIFLGNVKMDLGGGGTRQTSADVVKSVLAPWGFFFFFLKEVVFIFRGGRRRQKMKMLHVHFYLHLCSWAAFSSSTVWASFCSPPRLTKEARPSSFLPAVGWTPHLRRRDTQTQFHCVRIIYITCSIKVYLPQHSHSFLYLFCIEHTMCKME